jgi:hypothetical protein
MTTDDILAELRNINDSLENITSAIKSLLERLTAKEEKGEEKGNDENITNVRLY